MIQSLHCDELLQRTETHTHTKEAISCQMGECVNRANCLTLESYCGDFIAFSQSGEIKPFFKDGFIPVTFHSFGRGLLKIIYSPFALMCGIQ